MRSMVHRLWMIAKAILSTSSIILIGIGTNALYDAVKAFSGIDSGVNFIGSLSIGLVATAIGMIVGALITIPMLRSVLLKSRARIWRVDRGVAPRFRAVVLMPSLVREQKFPLTQKALDIARQDGDPRHKLMTLCDPTSEFTRSFWPWQQTLRLVAHNYEAIEVIVCLLSRAARTEFPALLEILQKVGPPRLRVIAIERDVSTNDYNDVEQALEEAVDVCKQAGVKLDEICIDITSGTKAYSAAATVKTLNGPLKFSYVHTQTLGEENAADPDVGKVIIYDTKSYR